MSDKLTGGPAFPTRRWIDSLDPEVVNPQLIEGMTFRDYLAAKAMQAYIVSSMGTLSVTYEKTPDLVNPIIAKAAYETADSMLQERNK
jgi:hypothetical protein